MIKPAEERIQLTTHHPSGRQLPIPGPLQSDEDVHIPRLCSPGLQTCPMQTNVEVTKNNKHGEKTRGKSRGGPTQWRSREDGRGGGGRLRKGGLRCTACDVSRVSLVRARAARAE